MLAGPPPLKLSNTASPLLDAGFRHKFRHFEKILGDSIPLKRQKKTETNLGLPLDKALLNKTGISRKGCTNFDITQESIHLLAIDTQFHFLHSGKLG